MGNRRRRATPPSLLFAAAFVAHSPKREWDGFGPRPNGAEASGHPAELVEGSRFGF